MELAGIVNDAESWEEGKIINWSALARKYEVHKPSDPTCTSLAGNGGQIIQAVLEDAGFDTSRFVDGKGQQTGAPRCRRSKLRRESGIAFPSQTPFSKLQGKRTKCMTITFSTSQLTLFLEILNRHAYKITGR